MRSNCFPSLVSGSYGSLTSLPDNFGKNIGIVNDHIAASVNGITHCKLSIKRSAQMRIATAKNAKGAE
jgi:hypothetical protein